MAKQQVTQLSNNNLVVRVDQNSESHLQALFDSVLKPDPKRSLQVPLRMRNLPDSFFNPPSTGSKSLSNSHSRENSIDLASGTAVVAAVAVGGGYAGATGTTRTGDISVAGSDINSGSIASANQGLTMAHLRVQSSPASLQQTYTSAQLATKHAPQPHARHHHHQKQRSYNVISTLDDLGPLPHGWEQARTPEGQIYFLNHFTKTTTWEDPRKTAPSVNVTAVAAAVKSEKSCIGTLGPLPDGWEQAQTPQGETYFINHHTRTTSWFDPRIPTHLQRTPTSGAILPQNFLPQSGGGGIQSNETLQACQQKLRLHSLQMERERLKQHQQEILRQQELMLRQCSTEVTMDPYLSSINNQHARQDSADSGLKIGSAYSLPHASKDFIAEIDESIDGTCEGGVPMETSDLSTISDIDSTVYQMPCLQLGDEFSSELLDDLQSLISPNTAKLENVLTWL